MIELYTKLPDDVDYQEDILEITNEFDAYLQQIKNIFSPEPGAVMGAEDMAVDLERYIYEMSFSAERLRKKISELIHRYCSYSELFRTTVRVKFAKGTKRDMAFIDIIINNRDNNKKISVFIK